MAKKNSGVQVIPNFSFAVWNALIHVTPMTLNSIRQEKMEKGGEMSADPTLYDQSWWGAEKLRISSSEENKDYCLRILRIWLKIKIRRSPTK